MKFSCLLVLLMWRGAFGLQDQFIGLNDIDQIEKIEKEIQNFGAKKQSIVTQFKLWQQGASAEKVAEVENSIKNIFSSDGELSPKVISRVMRDINLDKTDSDYRMDKTELSFAKIKNGFGPLFEFELRFHKYQSLTSNIEKKLSFNIEFNRDVIGLIQKMNAKQADFKHAMIILLTNIQNKRQHDFNIRQFYFKNQYLAEELYILRRDDPNVNQLYKIWGEQKTHFFEEHELLKENYDRLNQLLVDFYNEVLSLQSLYSETSKKVELMDVVDDRVLNGIERLLDIKRAVADVIALYRNQVTLIQNQRAVFYKIYQTSQRIKGLALEKKVQQIRISGQENLIKDILEEEKDRTEAEMDAAEAYADELEAKADAKEMEENLRFRILNKSLPSEFEQRDIARKKRKQEREKRKKAREERKKAREQNAAASAKSTQSSSRVPDQSSENYFKNKEYTDKVDSYVQSINQKIDNGELSIADIEDPAISELVVENQLNKTKNGSSVAFISLVASLICLLLL